MTGPAKAWLDQPGVLHVDLSMKGTVDAGEPGFPWIISVSNATGSMDMDGSKNIGRFLLKIPAMGGFSDETLLIGDFEYARSNLGGNVWVRQQANGAIGLLRQSLADPTSTPLMDAVLAGQAQVSLGPDTDFNSTPAHTVVIAVQVPQSYDIERMYGDLLGSAVGSGPHPAWKPEPMKYQPVSVYVAADDGRPIGFCTILPSGNSDPKVAGDKTVELSGTFSRSTTPLVVKAPAKFKNGTNPYNPPR
jgi:hypothetical protein